MPYSKTLERASRATKRAAFGLAMATALSGCENALNNVYAESPPRVVEITAQNRALREMPPPTRRQIVAVYDFPDLTGQYKERENIQSLSRAVTQGGSPMLIKALQDAGERRWFTVLDRSALQDLLRERQIVTEMRRIYRGETEIDPSALGPMTHAGIILQGGIVGYDSNTQTGGWGARYLGIGGDKQWKLDVVTVSLRAVSTETGEVLASVLVEKPLASASLRGSVFRYVALDELLEVEAGVAANEPRQVAVQQAIEKAVTALIVEGAELGIWHFADRAAGARHIARYRAEKYAGDTPLTAATIVPPRTTNAAAIAQTTPTKRYARATTIRQLPPAGDERRATPPTPPKPVEGETLG